MTNQTQITCSNPECQRRIEEPILLSNLSIESGEQYFACPHCFTKLDTISTKPEGHEKKKQELRVKLKEKKERGYSKCGGYLGYLARLPENASVPRECLTCPKVLDCSMKTSDF